MNLWAISTRSIFCLLLTLLLVACAGATPEPSSATEAPAQGEVTQPLPTTTLMPAVLPTEQPGEPQLPIIAAPQPAVPEQRRLTLEYPPRIRAGDSDVVRLTLEVDQNGYITPTAVVEGNVITGQTIEIPNLYETHHVIAESKFDVAGIQVSPPGLTSQTLVPGHTVMFFWSIRPEDPGVYRGTVWLYLRFVDKVSGEESQAAVSAQIVEIEAVNLFGIPANVVRFAGGVGTVIGSIIGFPFFEDILRFLWGRRKMRRTPV